MITIYHLDYDKVKEAPELMEIYRSAMFLPKEPQIVGALDSGLYKKVAQVDTNDLEVAYSKTNSIDYHWSDNPEVKEFGSRNKSTSVGDLAEKDGVLYYVASIGFKALPEGSLEKLPKENKRYKI